MPGGKRQRNLLRKAHVYDKVTDKRRTIQHNKKVKKETTYLFIKLMKGKAGRRVSNG